MKQSGRALRVQTLGSLSAKIDGTAVRPPLRALAAFVYLAVEGGPVTRSRLAEMFWSDHSVDRARGNLRVLLSRARATVGDYYATDRDTVWLCGSVELDIDTWPSDDLAAFSAAYSGDFLADWVASGSLFDDWVEQHRAAVRRDYVRRLEAAMGVAGAADRWLQVEHAARVGLRVEPWSESIAAHLVEATRRLHGLAAATSVYVDFVESLATGLGSGPSAELSRRVEGLLDESAPPARTPEMERHDLDRARAMLTGQRASEALSLLASIPREIGGDAGRTALLIASLAATGRREAALTEYRRYFDHVMASGGLVHPHLEQLERQVLAEAPDLLDNPLVAAPSPVPGATLGQELPPIAPPPLSRTLERTFPVVERTLTHRGTTIDLATAPDDGSVLVVPGEAGAGKTTLVSTLAQRWHTQGVFAVYGSSDEGGDDPLQPFREICGELVDRLPYVALRSHFVVHGPTLGRIAPLLFTRLGIEITDTWGSDDDRTGFLEALSDLFERAASDRPSAFIIDDLHWAGPGSIEALAHVAKRLTRGIVVVGYRHTRPDASAELRSSIATLVRRGATALDPLLAFTDAQVCELAEQKCKALSPGATVEPGLVQQVVALTGGHPLYTSELIDHRLGIGLGGRAHATTRDSEVPGTLHDLISARIESLGGPATELMQAASVLRPRVLPQELFDLVDLGDDQCVTIIDDAIACGLLRASGDELFFSHDVVARSVYDDIGPLRRRSLHERAARLLAGAPDDAIDADAGLPAAIARHLRLANQPQTAWRWEVRAGQAALRLLDPAGAARWFEQARDNAKSAGVEAAELLQLDLARGRALHLAGSPLARDELLSVAESARLIDDRQTLIDAAVLNTRGFQLSWDPERVAILDAACTAVTGGPDRAAEHALLQSLLAMELHTGPRHDEVSGLAEVAMRAVRSIGDPALIASVGANVGNALWQPGLLKRRREMLAEALCHIDALPNASDQFRLAWAAHSAAVEAGDAPGARDLVTRMNDLAEASVSRQTDWPMGLVTTFWTTMDGDLDAAERSANQTFAISSELGESDGFQMYAAQLMVVRSYRGDLDDLFPLVEAAAAEPGAAVAVTAAFGIMCARSGRPDEATAILHQAAKGGFGDLDPDFLWVTSMMAYSIMTNALGDRGIAEQIRADLEPHAETVAFSGLTSQGSVALQVGMLCTLLGDHGLADELLEHSLDVHRHLGWPVYIASSAVALAANEIARVGRLRQARQRLLDEAIEICDRHGFIPLGRAADAVTDTRGNRIGAG